MAYEGEDIDVLEGLEPVRKRPGMFIGGTGKTGLHHLLWEVLDNSVDEVANDYADEIEVIFHDDGRSATIKDDGRGIPVDEHPEHEIPALELILTTLHAGGKFNSENYITAGGLHGVGVSVVNALSKKLVAEVKRDGKKYRQKFERGEPTTELEVVSENVSETGTSIYFEPDPDIFESVDFDVDLIFERLEVKTYLNKGLKIHFKNEKNGEETEIENEDGIVGYLEKIIDEEGFTTVHDKPFVLSKDEELDGPESLDIALHWTEAPEENIYTFVNGIPTEDGGTHEQGLKAVVKDVIESYMDIHDIKPKRLDIKGKDTREGLVAVVNLFMTDPQFQGQTKDKLNNPSARSLIMSSLRTDFEQHLNDHPSVGKDICERVIQAAKARKAKRSTSSGGGGGKSQSRLDLPGKLADCSSNNPAESELFLVEGDSAGGSAKMARDRQTQAVLPLRGKVLNSERASKSRVRKNKELSSVIDTLGCGIGDDFNLGDLRYYKIILLMDADTDGYHISILLLTFFYRYMRPLIDGGFVYMAQPPLYRIDDGKETHWVSDDREKEEILQNSRTKNPDIQRFKGLGEMMPKSLRETTLSPETRSLLNITVPESDKLLTDQIITQLMGRDTTARYNFIMDHAGTADNIDV